MNDNTDCFAATLLALLDACYLTGRAMTEKKVPCNGRKKVFSGEDMECINPVKSAIWRIFNGVNL
jgi:hypothetical protein